MDLSVATKSDDQLTAKEKQELDILINGIIKNHSNNQQALVNYLKQSCVEIVSLKTRIDQLEQKLELLQGDAAVPGHNIEKNLEEALNWYLLRQ